MLMGVLFGKTYSMLEYLAACVLIVGLVLFILADSVTSPNFDPIGLVIISGALAADAFIGNVQESLMSSGARMMECLTWSCLVSSVVSGVMMVVSDDIVVTIRCGVPLPSRLFAAAHVCTHICCRWRLC